MVASIPPLTPFAEGTDHLLGLLMAPYITYKMCFELQLHLLTSQSNEFIGGWTTLKLYNIIVKKLMDIIFCTKLKSI